MKVATRVHGDLTNASRTTSQPLGQIATQVAGGLQANLEILQTPPPSRGLLARLRPKSMEVPPANNREAPKLDARALETSLTTIANIYADATIHEDELLSLMSAYPRLSKILELETALTNLPRKQRKRLETELFAPVRTLVEQCERHVKMLFGDLETRDLEALKQKVGRSPEPQHLDITSMRSGEELSGKARYQIGDHIRVGRSRGPAAPGVVVGHEPNGDLRVAFLANGKLALKPMSDSAVRMYNPLKIGDAIQFHENTFVVAGIDEHGAMIVRDSQARRVEATAFAASVGSAIDARYEAMLRGTPIEQIDAADSQVGFLAGNRETTKTVFKLKSPMAQGALHTDKGYEYKDWNEDGGVLFVDERGRLYAGVFDQAGGCGNDPNAHGKGSEVAARALFENAQEVAKHGGGLDAVEQAFVAALAEAHETLIGRRKGEITTFVGAAVEKAPDAEEGTALVVNAGDSGAMHFNHSGGHMATTEAHGFGRFLFEGAGMHENGVSKPPKHDTYRWNVRSGDYLVLGSDGLLDAGLSEQEIGAIITASGGDAFQATRDLRDIVKQRMKSGEGKKDNTTIAVIRIN